jgi:coenzyme PQQ biosynthesis protein PqqD
MTDRSAAMAQRPQKKSGFRLEVMDEDILLYDPQGEKIVQLNQPASLIWELCDGVRAVSEIVDLLASAYPESAGEIGGDVLETLQSLFEVGCIDLG